MNRFVFGCIRLVAHFHSAQVLDPAHTLHAWHHQTQGVAIFWAQHFTVLAIGNDDFTRCDQAHGDGAGHGRTVTAFGQNKLAVFQVSTGQLQQGDQGHARELAARNHAMGVLHCGHRHVAPLGGGVGSALDKGKARYGWQTHDLVHGENHVLFDHAVDHEAVLGRVNVPPALVVTLEVQTAGRDDTEQRLKWCKRHRGLGGLCQARALTALQVGFELGGLAIAFSGHALPQSYGVLRQVEDVGVATFNGHGVALGHGHGCNCASCSCCKGVADEITAALFAFGKDLLDARWGQEVFRCFLHSSRIDVVCVHTNSLLV